MILQASATVVGHERGLEAQQRKNFQRLYIMLLVTLLASALSLVLIWQSVRQREALRDAAVRKLAEGLTTFEEVMRVTADSE